MTIIAPSQLGIRGTDDYGSGAFGAARKKSSAGASWAVQRYEHKGVDFIVEPGQTILCPCDAWVVHYGLAYPALMADDEQFGSIHLESADDPEWRFKLLYASLIPDGVLPFMVKAGTPFARAQDLRTRYPNITPHIHLEIRHRGLLVDPLGLIAPTV